MSSWNDEESSGDYANLEDFTALDYAPETLHDPTFCGLAVGCEQVCRGHRLVPQKAVAFEGTNTGRWFYLCSVQNEVNNCGFVSWLDDDWPDSLKHTLSTLWGMYDDSNKARLDGRIESGKLFEELSEEKNKTDKRYTSLLADVKRFIECTEKQVMQENLAKMREAGEDPKLALSDFLKKEAEKDLGEMTIKMDLLKEELLLLKQVQKSDEEMWKMRQNQWDVAREELKEEKKKLEYTLYDLFKANDAKKYLVKLSEDKLRRIKEICNE